MLHHDEVPMVFVGDDGAPPIHRDIVVYPRDHPLQQISFISANCDPMIYPLLFPRGDSGWHQDITHLERYSTHNVTMLQFTHTGWQYASNLVQYITARNCSNNTWWMQS